ncbi:MAG: acyl-CoA desaturase [Burkholderiales bacterium]
MNADKHSPLRPVGRVLRSWFDNAAVQCADSSQSARNTKTVDWTRVVPFAALHAAPAAVIWVGWSWTALALAGLMYALRMVAITGFYHRYFSHRAFRTGRTTQFFLALMGASAAQRGPLWWASHHRHHHVHADNSQDAHSPHHEGFLWSHLGWFLSRPNFATRNHLIADFAKYRELRFLDRFDLAVPLALALLIYLLGEWLARDFAHLGTNGPQLLVWGFAISTLALYHATFTVNSLAHRYGKRRYATRDRSRNNPWLALLTFGEGWHNNHHHFPGSARQGFFWWEIDLTYYILRLLALSGIIWDLRPVPSQALSARLEKSVP